MSHSEGKTVSISGPAPTDKTVNVTLIAPPHGEVPAESGGTAVPPQRKRKVWKRAGYELAKKFLDKYQTEIAAGDMTREDALRRAADLYEKPDGSFFTVASLRNGWNQRKRKDDGNPPGSRRLIR